MQYESNSLVIVKIAIWECSKHIGGLVFEALGSILVSCRIERVRIFFSFSQFPFKWEVLIML